jgi:predicted porin
MKKLLLGTAAIALGMAFVTSPANAQVKLDVGGHFKGYVSWIDQDEGIDFDGDGSAEDARSFDILRETEVHFSGETTLDNGLTVGAHIEAEADGSDNRGGATDSFDVEESYVYFSGAWGRVNFGAEDGAAYLLQVAAPSADSNIDGIRQYVSPVQYGLHGDGALGIGDLALANIIFGPLRFDYDQAISDYDNKLTYMTPVFNGFQAGVSYTPEMTDGGDPLGDGTASFGVHTDDMEDDYGEIWDLAARYEGQFDQVGVALGAGWTHAELEQSVAVPVVGDLDDIEAWNVGVDLDWKAFGLGVVYTEDDLGLHGNSDQETWVVGVDYTTGPFKIGASYYNQDLELDGLSGAVGSDELDTERWTGGVVYTYGPGMTFRGSVSFIEHDLPGATAAGLGAGQPDFDATSVMLGTQINF